MSWEDTRGGIAPAARRTAHADDAKDRTDETHHTRRSPRSRGRSLVPAVVGGMLVLLIGGGTTAVWMSSRGDEPAPSSQAPGSKPTGSETPDATSPSADPTSGLPLEPTDEEVTYAGLVKCVENGEYLFGQCPSVVPETLTCPAGLCTITFFIGLPTLGETFASDPDVVVLTFRAGDPTLQYQGSDRESGPCPGRLRVNGNRQADGSYEIQVVDERRDFDNGACSQPSNSVFEVSLAPPL